MLSRTLLLGFVGLAHTLRSEPTCELREFSKGALVGTSRLVDHE